MTRRLPLTLAAAAAALALCVAATIMMAAPADAAVMGIDFGSEFIKVASVKPGTPFHIVVDEQSKRKIPSVVAFDNGERHFGNGAVQLAMRKPKDTYMWAHRLLGKDINSPQVAAMREQGFPWEIIELPDRRSLGFRHSVAKGANDADVVFSVEEIVAMSLQHIMKIAEADAESPVKDCVLTVPPYWTHRERQALVDAAEIAGLNVLSLLNENTAAAIQYGIDRKYNASETHTILLYNMGSTSTKVNLAHYSGFVRKERGGKTNKTIGQFEMKALGYDATLGGHAFEMRIVDWIVTEVSKQLSAKNPQKPYDIRTNIKAMAKIRSAAEKAKVVLSANQESVVFLNSLHDDMDFKMLITREQFYTMCADLLERVTQPIQTAMAESGLTMDQVDAVVIIGGGVRIPAVQAAIKSFVAKEHLTQSLNGDEAMVMGAVFRAANLSTTFQVRPFGMIDTHPYAVGVRITNKEEPTGAAAPAAAAAEDSADDADPSAHAIFSKRASLFKRYNRLMKKKTVQFTKNTDFVAQLSHEASKSNVLPAGIPLPIDLYNITGVARLLNNSRYTALLVDQKPRVSLSFLLDSSGLSTLVRAEATLEEMVKVPKIKKPVVKVNITDDAADAKKDDAAEEGAEKKDAEAPAADAAADAAAAAEAEEKKESEAAAAEAPKEGEEFTLKKKTHTIPLQVVRAGSPGSIESMNATHKFLSKATLEKLRRADDLKKEIAAAKNTLEAHIYSSRSSINEPDVESVSTEDQREAVRSALAAAEEWLYEQGDDSATVFTEKLSSLRALSEPIFFRLAESSALPAALQTTKTLIDFVRKQVTDYAKSRPWVTEAQRTSLADLADDVEEWLADQRAAQAKVAAHETPVFKSEQLYERIHPLQKLSSEIQKIKKPIEKPKPKPKPADKKKKKAAADADDAAEDSKDDGAAETASASTDDSASKDADQTTGSEDSATASADADDAAAEAEAAAELKKDEL